MTETATPAPADQEPEEARTEREQRHRRQTPAKQTLAVIRERLEDRLVEVESGPLEGLKVVSADNIREALEEPLPKLAIHGAQVQTPARVEVQALCPRCALPSNVSLEVTSELVVNVDGATLRPKVKATKVSHLCGQMPLPEGAAAGQQGFDLGDITGRSAVCPECQGEGRVPDLDGEEGETKVCLACDGEGTVAVTFPEEEDETDEDDDDDGGEEPGGTEPVEPEGDGDDGPGDALLPEPPPKKASAAADGYRVN